MALYCHIAVGVRVVEDEGDEGVGSREQGAGEAEISNDFRLLTVNC